MKIGIVTTWFERGAAYVSRQFMHVLEKTDEVYIYARGGEEYAIGNSKWDLKNVHWGKRNIGYTAILGSMYIDKKDFVKWINQNKIELVLFNEQQWFEPVVWCKELGIRSVAYIDYYTENTIPLFDVYDALICNTRRHAFAFRNHPNTNYIKWGTDIDLYKPLEYKRDKITFFHSAGMSPVRKGTDLLIEAFYNLSQRKKSKLLIHTQVPLDKKLPYLISKIRELEKEGSLEIVCETITAPGLYYRGDVYVYPSRLDGIGLTLMEAAASGLACITCDNPPMSEFIDSSFGVLCDIEYLYSRADGYYWPMCVTSVRSLSEHMGKFIDGIYDLNTMKIKAREYAIKELDFVKNCSQLHGILNVIKYSPLNDALKSQIYKHDYSSIKKYYKILSPLYLVYKSIRKYLCGNSN